jgi:antitoxin component YwqK of YwqJK toxin-antitoxin module
MQSCFPYRSPAPEKKQQESSLSHHVKKTYHQNGALHKEILYEYGLQQGVSKEYYKSGKVFQEVMYENNMREGVARRYFESGVVSQETPYHFDQMHGVQKRYRRSGNLMAEVPYYEGHLCTGLKEYTIDGKLKQRYPIIEVVTVDDIRRNATYTLKLKMSDNSKGVEYFVGELTGAKYIGSEAARVTAVENGVGEIKISLPRGSFVKEEVTIIARVKTSQSNYYITQSKLNLSIENRY